MSLTGLLRLPTLSVRIHCLWLQGALILENSRDLVIPECQSRTSWTGFFTCNAKIRISKNVIVKLSLLEFLKPGFDRNGGVLPKKKVNYYLDFFLVLSISPGIRIHLFLEGGLLWLRWRDVRFATTGAFAVNTQPLNPES